MSLISSGRLFKQKCVFWAKTGDVGEDGQPVYTAPWAINCRWEERIVVFTDAKGNQRTSRAVVYIKTDVPAESYLWLAACKASDPDEAALAELSSWIANNGVVANVDQPHLIPGAWQVQQFNGIPSLRNKDAKKLRVALL